MIHLANIANDPLVELDPHLSWEVNVLASQQLAEKAYRGVLKTRISKLYGGDVTIGKAKKLKARPNATNRDKQLANWFINMQQNRPSPGKMSDTPFKMSPLKCWKGYERVPGTQPGAKGSCRKICL